MRTQQRKISTIYTIKAFSELKGLCNLSPERVAKMKRAGPQILSRGSIGVKAFVEKLACAKAWLVRKKEGEVLMLLFTEENPVIKQYIRYSRGGPSLLDYI